MALVGCTSLKALASTVGLRRARYVAFSGTFCPVRGPTCPCGHPQVLTRVCPALRRRWDSGHPQAIDKGGYQQLAPFAMDRELAQTMKGPPAV